MEAWEQAIYEILDLVVTAIAFSAIGGVAIGLLIPMMKQEKYKKRLWTLCGLAFVMFILVIMLLVKIQQYFFLLKQYR